MPGRVSASAERSRRSTPLAVVGGALVLVGLVLTFVVPRHVGSPPDRAVTASADRAALPAVRHVFVINIENKGFPTLWGSHSAAPYLARTLRAKGVLLPQYYGTAHHSLGNYLAQISGQGPDYAIQHDCPIYSRFRETRPVAAQGQVVGDGCVYPKKVEHAARPAEQGGSGLARLHGGHGHAVPAPPARRPRPLAEGDGQVAVRHPAQPVRLLPVHHRPSGVLQGARQSAVGAGGRPEACVDDAGAHLHHARPVSRRARPALRRRRARRAPRGQHLGQALGPPDPRLARVPRGRRPRDHERRVGGGARGLQRLLRRGASGPTPDSPASRAPEAAGSARW